MASILREEVFAKRLGDIVLPTKAEVRILTDEREKKVLRLEYLDDQNGPKKSLSECKFAK